MDVKIDKFLDSHDEYESRATLFREAIASFLERDSRASVAKTNVIKEFAMELKAPLTVIKSFSHLLAKSTIVASLPKEEVMMIREIGTKATEMEHMINAGLNVATKQATYDVLIVDDDPGTIMVLEIVLASKNVTFRSLDRGKHVLETARQIRPSIVLLDINLPDVSGVQVCKAIKNDPGLVGTRVFFITAIHPEEANRHVKETSADGVFNKPFDMDSLETTILDILGQLP